MRDLRDLLRRDTKAVCFDELLNNIENIKSEETNDLSIIKNTISFLPETAEEKMTNEKYLESYYKYSHDFSDSSIVEEDILSEKNKRYTIFPIQYQTVWKNYKTQLKNNWVVEEVDLSKDIFDWNNKLSDDDRLFLMYVLAFFAIADGLVNSNIQENLINAVTIKEAECAYGKQQEMENAHGEQYSLLVDTYIKDQTLKNNIFNSIKTMHSIKRKAEWCKKWINSDKTYAHKLVAFAIVEGVFFSGSFASIFWLKTRAGRIMPGLRKANRFIARDEATHVALAVTLYGLLHNKLKESIVYEIIDEAVTIEDEFINDSLPCKLLGMNSLLMTQYIKYVSDRLLVQLGYNKKYLVSNPFDFMNKIDTYVKNNMFEDRTDTYQDSKIDNPRKSSDFEIMLNF